MKKILLTSSLVCSLFLIASGQNIYDSIFVGNRWRTYITHLPDGYNPAIKYPLVFCFHGGQANNASLGWSAIAFQSKLSQKSDSAGFILVYPEGTVFNNNRTWNAGNCCPPSMNQNVNDVEFVDHLLDTLIATFAVDTTRVYATGSSNGGMLCYRLACELSERIAAIAPNACSQMYFPCNPSRKIPIIHFHSFIDNEVPFDGGMGTGPSGISMTSQDSTMKLWKSLNHCTTVDTVVNGNGTNYNFIRIHNCSCDVEYHHYATTDGGHSWPGGNPNNNPSSKQISATELLWEFFKQYQVGCLQTSIMELNKKHIIIFPNPAHDIIQFTHLPEDFNGTVSIYNMMGILVCKEEKSGSTFSMPLDKLNCGLHHVAVHEHNRILHMQKVMKY